MRNGTSLYGGTNSGMKWARVALGGGGYTLRPRFSSDGTLVVSSDTAQSYYRKPSDTVWTPMVTAATAGFAVTYAAGGTLDTTIHRTNSNYMATWFGGFIWQCTDGATFAKLAGLSENRTMAPNGTNHTLPGYRLEYDSSTSILAFADASAGLRYTTDGGANFTTSASVPVATSDTDGAGMFVAFDRSSTVTSGKFQIVYAYSKGNGVYRSTTGITGTFSLISGSPTGLFDMKVGPTGILHVVLADGTAKKWNGSWATVTGIAAGDAFSVVPHISDATKVYWIGPGGRLFGSSDSGASSDRNAGFAPVTIATDISWLAWTKESYMSNSGGEYHPTLAQIVVGEGIGVWSTSTPLPASGDNGQVTWTSLTKGVENLDNMEHIITPNGRLISCYQDRPFFSWPTGSLNVYPSKHGPARTVAISHGTSVDYAGDNADFIVGVCSEAGKEGAYSSDGGRTWTQFATPSDVGMGNIAASTTQNWVWLPTSDRTPYYTTNGGTTWTACSFGGVSMSGINLHHFYAYQRRCLVADKAHAGTFYLYVWGNGNSDAADIAAQGIWKSTNNGATFARIRTTRLNGSNWDFYNSKLKMVPGQSPDMFWAPGDIGSFDATVETGTMWFSRDGAIWNQITSIDEPYDIAFGQPLVPGQTYPTIYVYGYVSGQLGLYRSTDFNPATRAATWVRIGTVSPVNSTDRSWTLSADMNSSLVVCGFGGSGLAYGVYDDTAHAT